ncbi:sulfatase family protein [Pedobacter glucosidilyticus]|uniref:sulfatase family protein n=1 Tax=Pedobacter glucosidilyticus TaxID=1122941 RepID=UPI0003FA899A|nr:sulfatase [Pedobacter glucosidilyticus]
MIFNKFINTPAKKLSKLMAFMLCFGAPVSTYAQEEKPNIVWIMAEDINNHLGSYGEEVVHTPNIDWLAKNGVQYQNAFTVSGVCAPSRAAIVTGMYSTSIGTQHMRQAKSLTPYAGVPFYNAVPPAYVKAFTEYLRANNYFCTNSFKTDYQFGTPFTVWDSHTLTAGWWDREDKNQPFFSCFTYQTTHEINTWPDSTKLRFFKEFNVDLKRLEEDVKSRPVLEEKYIINPAKVKLPPYYPDDTIVRQDYARHLTNINRMDTQIGKLINRLKADGLLDNTIIFFMGDNGDGLPRSKRWMNDGGIHVPLIIYTPEKWKNKIKGQLSGINEELVSFVDLAPTVLSIADIPIPNHIQGQAFLGKQKSAQARTYIFAGRDRMDAKYDLQRAVRTKQFKYIKNYWPDTAYNQYLDFMYQAPIMKRIDSLYHSKSLNSVQSAWMEASKPVEELYDVIKDPFELQNLALQPAYQAVLDTMRTALYNWQKKYGDWLDTPEIIQAEKMWPGGKQPLTSLPEYEQKDGFINLKCKTEGASIAYKYDGDKYWKLYNKPFKSMKKDIEVKAVRYGYKESDVITIASK